MRAVLSLVGIIAILIGLLWVGQGTGYVRWPASSFMISDMHWAYYGAAVAAVGLALVIFSRRSA
jgi:hypothetical protein